MEAPQPSQPPPAPSAHGAQNPPARERDSGFTSEIVAGRYLLTREAGRGGMCVVYEAQNRFTGRTVALKRLLPDCARSAEARARLLQEAIALGLVRHPNVVDVLDAGEDDGAPYIVMEMLGGRSLEGMLAARGAISVPETIDFARAASAALGAVHAAGIVHRDVKPGNLLVVESGEERKRLLKLIDLGVARMPESAATANKLTRAATIVGTPEYLPLEMLTASGAFAPSADVYALGVTLYECLTGEVPFPGTYGAVLRQVATSDPVPILTRRADTPPGLASVIMKALAREPEARFQDAREMSHAISVATGERRPEAGADLQAVRAGSPRRFERVPYITPVRVKFEQGLLDGRSEDLSEAGLMVLLPIAPPAGTTVQIRFALPRTGEVVGCGGVVRWVRAREARVCAVGLELVDVSPRVRAAIAEYVRSGG